MKREELKREEAKREEAKREEKRREEAKREQQRADAERKKKELADKEAKKAQEQIEAQRNKNIERMLDKAGATANGTIGGTAAQSAGPSAGYAGRIKARVRPNIVLTDTVDGNPLATVEVRLAPDGTIVARKLVKSSGAKSWDEAVLRAIDKTEILPRDVDGRVPSVIEIDFKPRE